MMSMDCSIPIVMDKKEAVREIKTSVLEKWNRKYSLSEKVDHIQEIYTEVGVRNCYGEKDRHTFSVINQLVSGHTNLNVYKSKLDKKESPLCIKCQVPEDVEHYMFHCDRYDEERKELEHSVEDILCREGINSVGVISLKVLIGVIEDISRQGQCNLIDALSKYIKCTKRF